MSPGSQMRALTANSAKANRPTISRGSRVVRKKLTKRKLYAILSGDQTSTRLQRPMRSSRVRLITVTIRPNQPLSC